MRLWIAFLALLTACGFQAPAIGDGGGGGEAVPPDAQACFGSFDFDKICFSVVPSMPVTTAGDAPINTDDAATCNPNVTGANKDRYCVIAGAGFTLAMGKTIRAFGSKPLVLLSTTNVDLQGGVDVSSHNAVGVTNLGAGANPSTLCANLLTATGNSGGFGGSFGGKGGDGEGVDGSHGSATPAVVGFPTVLRGGCPGGDGASITVGATPGAGGGGGGAVAIIAASRIDFNGKINASGAGGLGGSPLRCGGGGGGSGGMIVLDAPTITPGPTGLVFANGGGGAEGGAGAGSGGIASMGLPGGESTGPKVVGAKGGGVSGGDGGDGGDGAAAATVNGAAAGGTSQHDGGGGAGGGAAGFTRAPGVTDGNIIAPPPNNP